MSTEYKLYGVEKEDLYGSKTKQEREQLLYQMVMDAIELGIKPTARKYNTYPSTVRRWVEKYKLGGIDALTYKNH